MWVWKDFVDPLQLCFSGLTQISAWLLKDAVAQSCTGFAKMGCEGKGGMRAMEKQTYGIPAPNVCSSFHRTWNYTWPIAFKKPINNQLLISLSYTLPVVQMLSEMEIYLAEERRYGYCSQVVKVNPSVKKNKNKKKQMPPQWTKACVSLSHFHLGRCAAFIPTCTFLSACNDK